MPEDHQSVLAEVRRLVSESSFYMQLTTAVVNFVNGREQANDVLFKKMSDNEVFDAADVFRSLYLQAQMRSDQRVVKRTPAEWQEDQSMDRIVTQPYGWTHPGGTYKPKAWGDPVTRKEYLDRAGMSGSMLKEHGNMEFAYKEVQE